jgi:N-acetylated-alpha-linked acidic dipeptidase
MNLFSRLLLLICACRVAYPQAPIYTSKEFLHPNDLQTTSATATNLADADLNWEKQFRTIPNLDSLRAYMKRLSARPHHLGSPYDKDNAEWILTKFKSWGLEAQIETFEVLFPSPKERVVELVEPVKFVAALMVALMEEARAFGMLLEQGWKPKRTLIYCAWDAEEQGLIGSTEWAETHADELRQKAALYINTDSNGRGFLGMGGSHTLEKFINGVARDIEDPETKFSVWKRAQLRSIANARSAEDRRELRQRPDSRIFALGSGSDYTTFIDHLGIASLNLGYGGEDGGGIYHSIYDDFHWYTNFSDTAFVYGRALAQTAGTAAMRFAETDLLPYNFTNFAETIRKYLDELQKLVKNMRDEIAEQNTQIEEDVFTAIADPREQFVPPKAEALPPFLNFAPMENAVTALTRSAERYEKAAAKFRDSGQPVPKGVNQKLLQSERRLTLSDGLPNRPWFKHQIYAPGFYTGYGVKTIPAVREAIEQKKWKEADGQIIRVAKVLMDMATHIESAAQDLEAALR